MKFALGLIDIKCLLYLIPIILGYLLDIVSGT